MTLDLHSIPARVRALSPGWWGAVAAAAAAGATVFPGKRVLAGAGAGIAMLAIALLRETAGCATCADAPGPVVADAPPPPAPDRTWTGDFGLDTTTAGHKGC